MDDNMAFLHRGLLKSDQSLAHHQAANLSFTEDHF